MMLAGMGYEIGAQWRHDDDVTVARDSMHHREAMDSREARRSAKRASRPGLFDRLATTFQATTSARPAAR